MTNTTSTRPASLKGWIILGLLLSISIEFPLSDDYRAQLLLSLFLPLTTAVIANRFGLRVFDFLFVMAVPALLSVNSYLTDTLSITFEIPQWSFLLSVVTAFVFCRPPTYVPIQKIINQQWRWSRWVLLVAVWLMFTNLASLDFELDDSVSIQFGAGSLLLVIVLAISVQWSEFHLQFGKILSMARTRFGYYVRIAMVLLVGVAMLISVYVDVGYGLSISFGFSHGTSWFLVLVFCAVALGVIDWRLAIAVAVVMLAAEDTLWRLYEYLELLLVAQVPPAETIAGSGIESIVVTGSRLHFIDFLYWFDVIYTASFIHTVSFMLMAVALRPCLENRDPELLRSSRIDGRPCFAKLSINNCKKV